jgi:hypothetical protein
MSTAAPVGDILAIFTDSAVRITFLTYLIYDRLRSREDIEFCAKKVVNVMFVQTVSNGK